MADPQLTVIIVSYNTRQMTLECLRSLYDQTRSIDFETIVVDNNSPDGSAQAIAQSFPRATLIARTDNLGFAGANNLAAEQARGEFLLLLNPDTLVLDNAVERLMQFAMSRPDAGIWGGRTLYGDRSLNATSCFMRPTPWSLFCRGFGLTTAFKPWGWFDPEMLGTWKRDTEREVDIVTGCFFLIKKETWNALGGFDREFFMYGEEADLCLRGRSTLGLRPRVTPRATIVHYGGAAEKVRAAKLVHLLRAKTHLIRRHWPARDRWFGWWMLRQWCVLNSTLGWLLGLVGRKRAAETGATWREVYRRRAEWLTPPKPAAPPDSSTNGAPAERAAG